MNGHNPAGARQFIFNLGLICFSLFIALVISETALRLFFMKDYRPARISYTGGPEGEHTRILILGDSFMGESFRGPSMFREMIKHLAPGKFEVLNEAVGGMGPYEYLRQARKWIKRFRPRYVCLSYYAGDDLSKVIHTEHPDSFTGRIKDILRPFLDDLYLYHFYIEKRSLFFSGKLLKKARMNGADESVVKMAGEKKINPWLLDLSARSRDFFTEGLLMESPRSLQAAGEVRDIIGEILSLCRASGAELMMICVPDSTQVNDSHFDFLRKCGFNTDERTLSSDRPQEFLKDLCGELGVPYLDILPYFRADRGTEYYLKNDNHFNNKGAELAGSLAAGFIFNYTD